MLDEMLKSQGLLLTQKNLFTFLLKYEQLELKFDGNVVKIYGLWITVRRLKKQLNVFKLCLLRNT